VSFDRGVPPGYVALSEGGTEGALLATLERPLRAALAGGSFYGYAEHHPQARPLAGRGVAYAVPLPDGEANVVVRRSRHGGLLAPITGDRFFGRTRAPTELEISLTLARRDVLTPEVVAYATYPAGGIWRRADVATREIPRSQDLLAFLVAGELDDRQGAFVATRRLLTSLTDAGARHPDLNIKNILLARDANGTVEAYVLDVDRVWFDEPGSARVTEANRRRLRRSAAKHAGEYGLDFDAIFETP
jgi:3-deoxy-D-manno-octulosonic acid kinase